MIETEISRAPMPPFTRETALLKVRAAEDAWNSRDPARVALAYTIDSEWRNRDVFLTGRKAIVTLLTEKWSREEEYRLVKDLWAFTNNRIAVDFRGRAPLPLESRNAARHTFRSDRRRVMSVIPIVALPDRPRAA